MDNMKETKDTIEVRINELKTILERIKPIDSDKAVSSYMDSKNLHEIKEHVNGRLSQLQKQLSEFSEDKDDGEAETPSGRLLNEKSQDLSAEPE